MSTTEDRQLAQILAETVSELRVLRRQLATAVEALPMARHPEPSAPSPEPPGPATAGPRAQAPQVEQIVVSRQNPARLSAAAFQKPHKRVAPPAPSEPRAYSWEASVMSVAPPPAS